jgi:Mrp family chromosome partitioning ATPase
MIIDAPPLLSHGETLLMSSSVDSVLLSVMSCRTIAKELPLTIDKLNRSSSPVSGIVYIGSSMESSPSQKAVAT